MHDSPLGLTLFAGMATGFSAGVMLYAFFVEIFVQGTDSLVESYGKGHDSLLERASMIVNSNRHLNAFMYEPIIDLGSETLIALYDQVMKLNPANGD